MARKKVTIEAVSMAEEAKPFPTEEEVVAWAKEQGYNIPDEILGREIIVDFFRGVMNTPDDLFGDLMYSQWLTKHEALSAVIAPLDGVDPSALVVAINNAPADVRPYLNRLLDSYMAFGAWAEQCFAFDWILHNTEVPDAFSPGE